MKLKFQRSLVLVVSAVLTACAANGPAPKGGATQTASPAPAKSGVIEAPSNTRAQRAPDLVVGTGTFTRQAGTATLPSPPGAPSNTPTAPPAPAPGAQPGASPAQAPSASPGALPPADGAVTSAAPSPTATPQSGFQLSFVDTEIALVVSSVLGDGLGVPYVMDPKLKGTMTLQSPRPLTRDELLVAFESALRIYGAVLVESNGVYNVVPSADARSRTPKIRGPGEMGPGYAVQVVPLRYVAATDIEKVLRSVAPDGAILRVDEGRNLLVLAGTGPEIASMLEAVSMFDVDWLAGMSFGLFPLEYVDAKTAADELTQIFTDTKSPVASVVRFVPIARLNSLMVVSYQAHYLKEIEGWIKKLDLGAPTSTRRIYVYDVQNGKADELAKSLTHILSMGSSYDGYGSERTGSSPPFSNGQSSSMSGGGGGLGRGSLSSNGSGGSFGSRSGAGSQGAYDGGGSGYGGGGGYDRYDSGRSRGGTALSEGGVNIEPHEETNSLMILASPAEFAVIEAALKRLDIPPLQVMIEASLAEVTLTDNLRFGLQWAYQGKNGPVTFSEASNGAIKSEFPGLSYLFVGRQDIQAVLNSIETVTKVRVLSAPKLMVLNNREAELQIGDQVPVVTQSAVSTVTANAPIVNSVQMQDTGVILRVIPRVNQNGSVMLDISQEVSDVVPTTTSAINSPTIQQRKLSSTVVVRDGETLALGGLIREGRSRSRDGIPLLSKIPVIGALFGTTSSVQNRTELIVLLTPHVVRSEQERTSLMEDLGDQFRALRKTIPVWPGAQPERKEK